jgi:hypothetical protein
MNMKPILAAMAIAMATSAITPVVAQSSSGSWHQGSGGGWDRETFWRGAPQTTRERIQWLQQRIDRGIADGSLNRREARNSQRELDNIRRTAMRMRADRGGDLSRRDRDYIQTRLDNLSQQLRWRRSDGSYGYYQAGPDAGYRDQGGYRDQAGYRDQYATDYDARQYYRDDPRYQERRLSSNDEVYRGSDGRYYCKRNDGTTGLIIGAVGGGAIGNIIDGGHNRVAGTLIGGALGALAGKSIDQNSDIRCR